MIFRAFLSVASCNTRHTKEPNGLSRSDDKRPDGLILIPWQGDKSLCCDVTVACPVANSYTDCKWICRCCGRNGCHPQECQVRRTRKSVLLSTGCFTDTTLGPTNSTMFIHMLASFFQTLVGGFLEDLWMPGNFLLVSACFYFTFSV